jgi:uncharacterized protein YjbI with pentapeptide repeats
MFGDNLNGVGFANKLLVCKPANFSGTNLSGVSFGRAILSGVNLAWANLDGADFTGAEIEGIQNMEKAKNIQKAKGLLR